MLDLGSGGQPYRSLFTRSVSSDRDPIKPFVRLGYFVGQCWATCPWTAFIGWGGHLELYRGGQEARPRRDSRKGLI